MDDKLVLVMILALAGLIWFSPRPIPRPAQSCSCERTIDFFAKDGGPP